MSIIYFDTSAIVKLVRIEAESPAIRAWLASPARADSLFVSSALALTEVPRALRRIATRARLPAFGQTLDMFTLRNVDEEVLVTAGAYRSPNLRSLDAIHLATARALATAAGGAFEALVTYDVRLAAAATAEGLHVVAPR